MRLDYWLKVHASSMVVVTIGMGIDVYVQVRS